MLRSNCAVARLHECLIDSSTKFNLCAFRFLIWTWGQDMRREYAEFFQVQGVDGVFTDFPGTLAEYFNYMVLSAA